MLFWTAIVNFMHLQFLTSLLPLTIPADLKVT